jgi:transposase
MDRTRASRLRSVTIDMSGYIDAVQRGAARAEITVDRFHVQRVAQDAVIKSEEIRSDAQRLRRRLGAEEDGLGPLKNPRNLSAVDGDKLVDVQRTNRPLYLAYLLKETLAEIFTSSS